MKERYKYVHVFNHIQKFEFVFLNVIQKLRAEWRYGESTMVYTGHIEILGL